MSDRGSQPKSGGLALLPWPVAVDVGSGNIVLESSAFELILEDGPPPAGWKDPSEREGPAAPASSASSASSVSSAASAASAAIQRAVMKLGRDVASRTGLSPADPVPVRVSSGGSGSLVPGLDEDESYWLVVDDAGIYIDAASPWGVLHGLTTLSQLVDARGRIPHVAIDDRPAYAWRGLLLDPARHFLPAEDILRTLEAMARCKLNVLHLHLTDDQGFRFHVPEYPKLASVEAYTDEDLAEIVAHAAELGIRVLPEVDMPGHVTSWLTAYPELGARQVEPAERFGVHAACLDPTSEAVFAVIGCILDTLVRIFPDSCLHIGGDEVSPRWWSEDPKVRELMDREELDDVRAVQGYFNRRVGHMVTERGRRVVAWDEVLDAGAGSEWIIQAWRGSTMRDRARALGHAVVLSAPYYLDLHYPADVHYAFSPAASQSALLELEDALPQDPRFAHVAGGIRWTEQWRQGAVALEPDESGVRILGAEACLWSELVNSKVLDLRLWSRLPAVAERFWSSPSLTDSQDMYRRQDLFIDQVLPQCGIDLNGGTRSRWRTLGIESRWDDLLEMLEPVKWYGRLLGAEALAARLAGTEMPQARPYDLSSRLDGLIDHLPVDGRKARQVALSCERAGSGDEGAREDVDLTIHRWRALAEAHAEAPEGLGPMAVKLGVLGQLIARRLADGVRAEPSALSELLVPEGEFILALPPSLYRWLVVP